MVQLGIRKSANGGASTFDGEKMEVWREVGVVMGLSGSQLEIQVSWTSLAIRRY